MKGLDAQSLIDQIVSLIRERDAAQSSNRRLTDDLWRAKERAEDLKRALDTAHELLAADPHHAKSYQEDNRRLSGEVAEAKRLAAEARNHLYGMNRVADTDLTSYEAAKRFLDQILPAASAPAEEAPFINQVLAVMRPLFDALHVRGIEGEKAIEMVKRTVDEAARRIVRVDGILREIADDECRCQPDWTCSKCLARGAIGSTAQAGKEKT